VVPKPYRAHLANLRCPRNGKRCHRFHRFLWGLMARVSQSGHCPDWTGWEGQKPRYASPDTGHRIAFRRAGVGLGKPLDVGVSRQPA
jgi:hypothetical protein